MKIGVCGYYGMGNAGDEAILEGLKAMLFKVYPGSEIIVFGHGNLLPIGFRSFLKSLFSHRTWRKPIEEMRKCDLIIIGGGGLFTAEEKHFVPSFWALHGLIAHALNKPVMCLGISVSPLRGINKLLTKKLFVIARLITVRDPASYKIIKGWGVHARLTSDLALLFPLRKTDLPDRKKYIVLCIRRFKNYDEKLYTLFAQFCDRVIDKYGLNIMLLELQGGAKFDRYILNKIYVHAKRKKNIHIHEYLGSNDVIKTIAHSQACVTMRLHGGIFSLMTKTPFIPLSYMSKVADFWNEFEDISPMQLRGLNVNSLMARFDELVTNRAHEVENLEKIWETLTERIALNEKLIAGFQIR